MQREEHTSINLLRILNIAHDEYIAKVCTLDREAPRDPASREHQRFVRDGSPVSETYTSRGCIDSVDLYACPQVNTVLRLELGRRAPFDLGGVGDERLAQLSPVRGILHHFVINNPRVYAYLSMGL